ncbi:GDSL esterase/lipase CPRD49-like isoform X2 [Abrus precatorius]|uniref:GDSL esterase/lipase CPRD49-like isoform X2 n=1 Tax=Abrus precatorius TaxID=3816 RepID=A0A8B8L7U7_ABRPR|nr:GDSL esterase/lipase CPRD49-like isoform X2 [Abrus precatorius]
MSGATRPQFVLFGSSIVQFGYYEGWGATLSHLYSRKADIVLRGYAGWNSRRALEILDKIFPKGLSTKTRTIFLSTPPINEAQIHENCDPEGHQLRTNEACRIYSEACLELCREMNIKAIDLWSAIQKRDDWQDVCFIDGIHLSAEGSKIVSKEILKVLKESEWKPSLHWKEMPSDFAEDSPYDPVASDGKTTINLSDFAFPSDEEWD